MSVSALTIWLPQGPLDFELLEVGPESRLRRPSAISFTSLFALDDLWSDADEDREELALSGPVSFRIGEGAVVSVGQGCALQVGLQDGEAVALLLDGARKAVADYSGGRWRWHGGRESSRLLLIGLPALLIKETAVPETALPGKRSRPSDLAERRLAIGQERAKVEM